MNTNVNNENSSYTVSYIDGNTVKHETYADEKSALLSIQKSCTSLGRELKQLSVTTNRHKAESFAKINALIQAAEENQAVISRLYYEERIKNQNSLIGKFINALASKNIHIGKIGEYHKLAKAFKTIQNSRNHEIIPKLTECGLYFNVNSKTGKTTLDAVATIENNWLSFIGEISQGKYYVGILQYPQSPEKLSFISLGKTENNDIVNYHGSITYLGNNEHDEPKFTVEIEKTKIGPTKSFLVIGIDELRYALTHTNYDSEDPYREEATYHPLHDLSCIIQNVQSKENNKSDYIS